MDEKKNLLPLHKRWPGKYTARLRLYDPDSTMVEFETSMSNKYGGALMKEFIRLVRGEDPRPELSQGEAAKPAASSAGEYVIMCVRISTSGMTYFWRPNGSGYTPDLDEAGRYTKEKADSIVSGLGPERKEVVASFAEIERTAKRFVSDDVAHAKWNESRQAEEVCTRCMGRGSVDRNEGRVDFDADGPVSTTCRKIDGGCDGSGRRPRSSEK